MRRFLCIFLTISTIFGLFGCAKKPKEDPVAPRPAGYSDTGAVISGGKALSGLNAKRLSFDHIPHEDTGKSETVISFDFVSGSLISAGLAETDGLGIPAYKVYTLPEPSRLVIEFSDLTYWDYTRELALNNSFITGCFLDSTASEPTVSILFQLKEAAYFKVKESGDTLSVHLLPKDIPEDEKQEQFFVTLNAYNAYCQGLISRELGFTPTLASDYTNILLISQPFDTMEAAEAFLNTTRNRNRDIPAEQWQTVSLTKGKLPKYQAELEQIHIYQTPVIRLNGQLLTLPVLAADGLYLCDAQDGGFLYSKEFSIQDGEETRIYQQLWHMQANGQPRLLTDFEFSAIEQVQFSPDGRKLAVLERDNGSTHLYVFDTDTYELLNDLSEMGFGANTSTFLWNTMGNILYAVTGISGMQLHQFDYSIPDEAQRHSQVDKNSVDEGGLGYFDGELYFCASSLEGGAYLYRIKPEGGIRKQFIPGSSFVISDDNRYMAVISSSETSATNTQELSVYDLSTGSSQQITDAFFPYDIIWSQDCQTLYYIESRISGGQSEDSTSDDVQTEDITTENPAVDEENEEPEHTPQALADDYPYTLWAYDIATKQSQRILDLSAPDLYPAKEHHVLYVNHYVTDESSLPLRACYRLDLNALTTESAETLTTE